MPDDKSEPYKKIDSANGKQRSGDSSLDSFRIPSIASLRELKDKYEGMRKQLDSTPILPSNNFLGSLAERKSYGDQVVKLLSGAGDVIKWASGTITLDVTVGKSDCVVTIEPHTITLDKNGAHISCLPGGVTEIQYPNGTKKMLGPEGSLTSFTNGTTVFESRNGAKLTSLPNGASITERPGQPTVIERGGRTVELPSGGEPFVADDGKGSNTEKDAGKKAAPDASKFSLIGRVLGALKEEATNIVDKDAAPDESKIARLLNGIAIPPEPVSPALSKDTAQLVEKLVSTESPKEKPIELKLPFGISIELPPQVPTDKGSTGYKYLDLVGNPTTNTADVRAVIAETKDSLGLVTKVAKYSSPAAAESGKPDVIVERKPLTGAERTEVKTVFDNTNAEHTLKTGVAVRTVNIETGERTVTEESVIDGSLQTLKFDTRGYPIQLRVKADGHEYDYELADGKIVGLKIDGKSVNGDSSEFKNLQSHGAQVIENVKNAYNIGPYEAELTLAFLNRTVSATERSQILSDLKTLYEHSSNDRHKYLALTYGCFRVLSAGLMAVNSANSHEGTAPIETAKALQQILDMAREKPPVPLAMDLMEAFGGDDESMTAKRVEGLLADLASGKPEVQKLALKQVAEVLTPAISRAMDQERADCIASAASQQPTAEQLVQAQQALGHEMEAGNPFVIKDVLDHISTNATLAYLSRITSDSPESVEQVSDLTRSLVHRSLTDENAHAALCTILTTGTDERSTRWLAVQQGERVREWPELKNLAAKELNAAKIIAIQQFNYELRVRNGSLSEADATALVAAFNKARIGGDEFLQKQLQEAINTALQGSNKKLILEAMADAVQAGTPGAIELVIKDDTTVTAKDGSAVVINGNGQVKGTTDTRGNVSNYRYDSAENLMAYSDKTGDWSKDTDGIWRNSTSGDEFRGRRWVTPDGALNELPENGKHMVRRLDGSQFTLDEKGRITESIDARGNKLSYEYKGDSQQPHTVDYGTGKWVDLGNGTWEKKRADGSKESWTGSTKLNQQDGTLVETWRDGSSRTRSADGSDIWRNNKGDIYYLTDADGKTFKFSYDNSRHLIQVTYPNGSVAENKGDHWEKRSPSDPTRGVDSISLDKDGVLTEKYSGPNYTITHKPDGTETLRDKQDRIVQQKHGDTTTTTRWEEASNKVIEKKITTGDKAVITVNSSEQVTEAQLPNGELRKFERDAAGNIRKITESSGLVLTSDDGSTFKNNATGEIISGKIVVNKDGSYAIKQPSGEEFRRNRDGTTTITAGQNNLTINRDNSQLLRNSKGALLAIVDVAGQRTTFEPADRGSNEEPTKIQLANGKSWQKLEDGSWISQDGEAMEGSWSLSGNGDLTRHSSNSKEAIAFKIAKIDGSSVELNRDGLVAQTIDAQGRTSDYSYDSAHNLIALQLPDGSSWTKLGPRSWIKEGTSETFNGEISISLDGSLRLKGDNTDVIKHSNGWEESNDSIGLKIFKRHNSDGSEVIKDRLGHIIEIKDAKGQSRKFDYDDAGQIKKVTYPSGSSWTTADGLNWKKTGSGEPWRGTVAVSDNGTYIETSPNKSRIHIFKSDGAELTLDHGRVMEIYNKLGDCTKLDYDERGRLKSVRFPNDDGDVWETIDGIVFEKHNKAGQVLGKAQFRLNDDGSLTQTLKLGEKQLERVYKTDGSSFDSQTGLTRTQQQDGSVIYTNRQGLIHQVITKQGEVTTYGYDEQGRLNRFQNKDGDHTTSNFREWSVQKPGDTSIATFQAEITVLKDGTQRERGSDGTVRFYRLDGSVIVHGRGNVRVYDCKDPDTAKIIETVDSNGKHRYFEYGNIFKHGKVIPNQLIALKSDGDQDFTILETGLYWKKPNGEYWHGAKILSADGTLQEITVNGPLITTRLDGSTSTDYDKRPAELEARAAAIFEALSSSTTWKSTRAEVIQKQLKEISAAEAQIVLQKVQDKWNAAYDRGKDIKGILIEYLGETYKGIGLDHLTRADAPNLGEIQRDTAGRIHQALMEFEGGWYGRSQADLLLDIRTTLSTMTRAEIQKADEDYQRRYGKSMYTALNGSERIASADNGFTKELVTVYLFGADKISDEQRARLLKMAYDTGDINKFGEVAQAFKEHIGARNRFLGMLGFQESDAGLKAFDEKLKEKYGGWFSDKDAIYAHDFSLYGKLTEGTRFSDATGWFSNDEKTQDKILREMTPERRELFFRGAYLFRHSIEPTNASDREAKELYQKLATAIGQAYVWGHEYKVAAAMDKVKVEGGGLIAELSAHAGEIKASGLKEQLATVQNMSKSSWEALVADPKYLDKLERQLSYNLGYGKFEEVKRLLLEKLSLKKELDSMDREQLKHSLHFIGRSDDNLSKFLDGRELARKAADKAGGDPLQLARAEKEASEESEKPRDSKNQEDLKDCLEFYKNEIYTAVKVGARRNIINALRDLEGDKKACVEAIQKMTPKERAQYKDDETFRDALNARVEEVLSKDGSAYKTARQLLKKIEEDPGKAPELDLIGRLNLLSLDKSNTFGSTVREIDKAFKEDVSLRQKLREDPAFAAEFKEATQRAGISADCFNTVIKPLLERGSLTADGLLYLGGRRAGYQYADGRLSLGGQEGLGKTLIAMSPEALKSINENEADRNKLVRAFHPEHRKIAENILKQGAASPADQMRMFVLGAGVTAEQVKNILGAMSLDQRRALVGEYAHKYGLRDLRADLKGKADSSDKEEFEYLTRTTALAADLRFSMAADKAAASTNWTSGLMKYTHYGGALSEMKTNLGDFQSTLEKASAKGEQVAAAEVDKREASFREGLTNFREAKEQFADSVTNSIITVSALAAAPFTGGASLTPLLVAAAAGAVIKTGAHMMISGSDFDMSADNIAQKAFSGAIEGGASMLNAGHIGAVMGKLGIIGRAATREAASLAVGTLGRTLTAEGEQFIANELKGAMGAALLSRAAGVTEKEILAVAEKAVARGFIKASEKELLTRALSQGLSKAIASETKSLIRSSIYEAGHGLANFGTGAASAVAGTAVDQTFKGQFSLSELSQSGIEGGLGGLAMSSFGRMFHVAGSHYLDAEKLNIQSRGKVVQYAFKGAEYAYGVISAVGSGALGDSVTQAGLHGEVSLGKIGESALKMGVGSGLGGFHGLANKPRHEEPARESATRGSKAPAYGESVSVKPDRPAISETAKPARSLPAPVDLNATMKVSGRNNLEAADKPGGAPKDRGSQRIVKFEGDPKEYHLDRRGIGPKEEKAESYFFGKRPADNRIPASENKVHVFGNSPEELAKLQKVLIPALEQDPELADLVKAWKTLDPALAQADSDVKPTARSTRPGETGQNAKAFTLYTDSPEAAAAVAAKIDAILAQHTELTLATPRNTGTIDSITGVTNRVGISRDNFLRSVDSTAKQPVVKIDPEVSRRVHERAGASQLTDTQLRQVERVLGLKENTLLYDSQNNLALRLSGPTNSLPVSADHLYVKESQSPVGGKVDRQALYELSRRVGLDPPEVAARKADARETPPKQEQLSPVEGKAEQERVNRPWEQALARPTFELQGKLENLKQDLDIHFWNLPSTRRAKLIKDLNENIRIMVHEAPDGGPKIHNGNTRYYYAKLLGIPDSEISVFDITSKRKISMEDFRKSLEKKHGERQSGAAAEASPQGAFRKLDNCLQTTQKQLQELTGKDNSPANHLAQKLIAPGGEQLCMQLFGSDKPPEAVEQVLDTVRRNGKWDEGKASEVFQQLLLERERSLRDSAAALTKVFGFDKPLSSRSTAAHGIEQKEPNPWAKKQVVDLGGGNSIELAQDKKVLMGIPDKQGVVAPQGELGYDEAGVYVKDKGSQEGIWVNGRRIRVNEQVYITPGDEVRLGSEHNGLPLSVKDERLWIPTRDIRQLTLEDWHRIKEFVSFNQLKQISPLHAVELVSKFSNSGSDVKGSWADDPIVNEHQMAFEAARRKVQELDEQARRILVTERRILSDEEFSSESTARAKLMSSGNSELISVYDELLKAKNNSRQAEDQLVKLLAPRLAEIQQILDEFTSRNHLPRVIAKLKGSIDGISKATYGDAKITMRTIDFLNNRRTDEFIGDLYHELVHHEQMYQTMRLTIDDVETRLRLKPELGPQYVIGKEAPPRLLSNIQELYKARTGIDISEDHLKNILAERNGQRLRTDNGSGTDERARASDLIKAFRRNAPMQLDYHEAEDHFKASERELARIRDKLGTEPARDLLERISGSQSGIVPKIFADEKIPAELQPYVTKLSSWTPAMEAEAGKILQHHLRQNMSLMNEFRGERYRAYVGEFHELEAWLIGERAKISARNHGPRGLDRAEVAARKADVRQTPAEGKEFSAHGLRTDPPPGEQGKTHTLGKGASETIIGRDLATVSGDAKVLAGEHARVEVPPHNNTEKPTVNIAENASADIHGPAAVTARGENAEVRVKPAPGHDTVRGVDIKLNEHARASVHEGEGKVTGSGYLDVSGSKTKLEVEVPKGETIRIVVREGSPDITVSPHSQGKIEIFMDNGQEMPAGLRAYKDSPANAGESKVHMLERRDLEKPVDHKGPQEAKIFSPAEMEQLGQRIEDRLRKQSEAISLDQWRGMFDGRHDFGDGKGPRAYTPEERALATEVMKQSAQNMNSRDVDAQMKDLAQYLKDSGFKDEKITVYTTDNISDGNALSHVFSKNTGIKVDIRVLSQKEMTDLKVKIDELKGIMENLNKINERLARMKEAKKKGELFEGKSVDGKEIEKLAKNGKSEHSKFIQLEGKLAAYLPRNVLVLDDVSKMSPQQRQTLADLSHIREVTVSNLNGFTRGMNMYDLAVTRMTGNADSMNQKLAGIVKNVQAIKEQHKGISDADAVKMDLQSSGPAALAPHQPAPEKLHGQPVPDAAVKRQQAFDRAGYTAEQKIDALYRHATEPMATKEQMQQYLANIATEYEKAQQARKERKLEPLAGSKEAYQSAALVALDQVAHLNDYGTMVKEIKQLERAIGKNLEAAGLGKNDYLLVTGTEPDGSSYLANSLYAKAAGLGPERTISMAELKELANKPQLAKERLGGKRLVFMDDYRNSGRQQAEQLGNFQRDVLSKITDSNGEPIVKEVIMANFAKHELRPGIDPVTQYGGLQPGTDRPSLHGAQPGSKEAAPPGALTVHSLVGEHYQNITDKAVMQRRGLTPYHEFLKDMGASSKYQQSSIASGVITPYGMPNNNPRFLLAADSPLVLPQRYGEGPAGLFSRAGEKNPLLPSQFSVGKWHGCAPDIEKPGQLDKLLKDSNASVVIDLRGADQREQTAVEAEQKALAEKGKRGINIPIPTEFPERGSPAYNKMLEQIHQFEQAMAKAKAEGKNVYFHCQWGQDRTGMMRALHETLSEGKSIDQALNNWKALKQGIYDESFLSLFHTDKFNKLVEDYKSKFPPGGRSGAEFGETSR